MGGVGLVCSEIVVLQPLARLHIVKVVLLGGQVGDGHTHIGRGGPLVGVAAESRQGHSQ